MGARAKANKKIIKRRRKQMIIYVAMLAVKLSPMLYFIDFIICFNVTQRHEL